MKKKIAIITEQVNSRGGGAERAVIELKAALTAMDFKVDILAARGQANAENVHILCQSTHVKRVWLCTFAERLKKYFSENHYDIIHSVLPFNFADVYQPRGGSYAESILRNADSFDNKFIASYKKATAFLNLRRTELLQAEKKLCKDPNGPLILALSEYVANQFKTHYNLEDERIRIVPNGVETDKPINREQSDKLRKQILSQLTLTETDKATFFLFAALNFRLKGLGPLIKALRSATEENIYVIVAGSGKIKKYRCLAEKFGVGERVVFLGDVADIQNLLSITDAAVLPTFYDPSSRFIIEALAAGKPVITTSFNGAAEMFVKDKHGLIIDKPQNTTALAEALSFFADRGNIEKTAQLIVKDNIKAKLTINRAAEQLGAIYESILIGKGQK